MCLSRRLDPCARHRFSTGRIVKWQPARLLYVQEIYRPWPFRRAKGRPRSLWQQTDGSQHLPFYFSGCKPSRRVSPLSLALFASNDSVASRPVAFTSYDRYSFFLSSYFSLYFFVVLFPLCLLVYWSDSQTSRTALLDDSVCCGFSCR